MREAPRVCIVFPMRIKASGKLNLGDIVYKSATSKVAWKVVYVGGRGTSGHQPEDGYALSKAASKTQAKGNASYHISELWVEEPGA